MFQVNGKILLGFVELVEHLIKIKFANTPINYQAIDELHETYLNATATTEFDFLGTKVLIIK